MNRTFIIVSLVAGSIVASCDKKSSGDDYDFSNSVSPYVALDNTDSMDAVQGDSMDVKFLIRTAFNKADETVTLTYHVSGAVTTPDQTVVINRNSLTATAHIWVPDGLVTDPDPDAFVEALVSLTKAVTSDGEELRIGQYNDPTLQTLRVKIFQP